MRHLSVRLACLSIMLSLVLGGCAAGGQTRSAESAKPVLVDTQDLVYVACEDSDEVVILRARDSSRVGSIAVGAAPHDLAYDPLSRRVYVTNGDAGTVSVIDTASKQVIGEIRVDGQPQGLALRRDGRLLYVADAISNSVVVIDTNAREVMSRIPVGAGPDSLALAPDDRRLFVVNLRSNNISVIDAGTNQVTGTIPAGRGPSGIAVSPDGAKLFVGGHGQHGSDKPMTNKSVMVMDVDTGRQLGTIETGSMPIALRLADNGKFLYVLCHGSGDLWLLDVGADSIQFFASRASANVRVGADPQALTVAGDGRLIYVVNASSNDVSVVDTLANRLVSTAQVGKRPVGIAVVH